MKLSKYLFPLLFLLSLANFSSAQNEAHVNGELIIQLYPGQSIDQFVAQPIYIEGTPVRFNLVKTLSRDMAAHLISFNPNDVPERLALLHVKAHPSISLAQYNHYIEHRATTPNDPQFGDMWGLNNTGQAGGTIDADIDAPEAWDIATGGLTTHGDTIVVATVDGGCDITHEDLFMWKNYAEIPGNGQDDDNNGYIDDYDGWNAYNSNGNVPNDQHGTHVSGTMAARGDNNIGVTGVNWAAQVMPIAASSGTESVVVEGYGFALAHRKRYNATNGAEGAFVVATNSSFGVNFGDPANFPIWCAFYDSLGHAGIISAGATMNIDSDVDVDGDVPTACPSDYMLAVTNTTRNDTKNNGAAYGATTIDLGAPGTDILSTTPGNNYGSLTGTSMATPHVAGAVALMYSAACPQLLTDYKNDLVNMTIVFRDFLLNNTDTIPALTGITVTNGRLNAFKMLSAIQDFCAGGTGCFTPFNLAVSNVVDTSADVTWANVAAATMGYNYQYRKVGDTIWIAGSDTLNTVNLTGLEPCTEYEFEVESACDTTESGFSNTLTFMTEGCCEFPAGVFADNLTDTTAQAYWGEVFAALGYNIEWRELGAPAWNSANVNNDSLLLINLLPCTNYELRVETVCDTGGSGFSSIISFKTKGCGVCEEGLHCNSDYDSGSEWIDNVTLNTINNTTGNDGGYGDYTLVSTDLERGVSYPVSLTPDFGFIPYDEYWRIWVDLNQDDDFADTGELVYDSQGAITGTANGNLTIPVGALLGNTKMRVGMHWNSAPTTCGTNGFGEAEDYCVNITLSTNSVALLEGQVVKIFPNPTKDLLNIISQATVTRLSIHNLLGQEMLSSDQEFTGEHTLNLEELQTGIYLLTLATENGKLVKKIVLE